MTETYETRGFFIAVGAGLFITLFEWIPVYTFPGTPKDSLLNIFMHAVEQTNASGETIAVAGFLYLVGLLMLGGIGSFIGGFFKK